ncbi:MAG: hypothetical protein QOF69_2479, partial [Solirubrobacteraceae bacterium]|nr:hypothetical protein [Solirubrobacteraceae bacterium]
ALLGLVGHLAPPRVDTESAASYPLDVEHELARQRSDGSVEACSGSRSRRGRAAQARQAANVLACSLSRRPTAIFSLPLASRARRCCSDLRQARQREILRPVDAVASCGAPSRVSVAAVAETVAASSGASSIIRSETGAAPGGNDVKDAQAQRCGDLRGKRGRASRSGIHRGYARRVGTLAVPGLLRPARGRAADLEASFQTERGQRGARATDSLPRITDPR